MTAGLAESLSRFGILLYGLLLGCLLLMRVGGLSLLRSRGFGRSMMIVCSSFLGRMLKSAAEAALADASVFRWSCTL